MDFITLIVVFVISLLIVLAIFRLFSIDTSLENGW